MKQSDYEKYRGKCKEFVDDTIKNDPTLTAVKGWYFDPIWGQQAHWWCKRQDGTIFDPTKDQFPSKGNGYYEEFDGWLECSNCGKSIHEDEVMIVGNGHYFICSEKCYKQFVGL